MSEISMEARIHAHIDRLFADVAAEPRVSEVKLEIYMDTLDRYHDLCAQGMDSEQAFEQSISSIGDIKEILSSLGIDVSSKGIKIDLSFEDEEKAEKTPRRKQLLSHLSTIVWMSMASVYFIISFTTGAWGITWICFPLALALQCVLHAIVDLATVNKPEIYYQYSPGAARLKRSLKSALWLTTLVVYFVVSLIVGWSFSWIIFLLGSAASNLLSIILIYTAAHTVPPEENEVNQE